MEKDEAMSQRLLQHILGDYYEQLNDHFDLSNRGPMAWYPSAGEDFRDLLYTRREYLQQYHRQAATSYQNPGIFIHNDIGHDPFGDSHERFLMTPYLHHDKNTKIKIEHIQRLPNVNVPLTQDMVDFKEPCQRYGHAYFMYLAVYSTKCDFYSFRVPLIYIFAENLALYRDVFRPNHVQFSHIIKVNHGTGFGGGTASGSWLMRILNETQCRYVYSDHILYDEIGDKFALEQMPQIQHNANELNEFKKVSTIPTKYWTYKGDVTIWQR